MSRYKERIVIDDRLVIGAIDDIIHSVHEKDTKMRRFSTREEFVNKAIIHEINKYRKLSF